MSGNAEEDSAPGKEPPGFRQEPGGSFLFNAPANSLASDTFPPNGGLMRTRRAGLAALLCLSAFLGGAAEGLLGLCGPFTDVAADVFCPFVLEIFYLGITTGTTATTYDPTANVTRLQMAAFLSRTVDGVLKRGSRRAILDQFWTAQNA